MAKCFGEVGPIYGRWQWPLKMMEPGDYFYVDHVLRPAEEVRHYVSVRAAQLSKLFSVQSNAPEKPGFTKVWMRDPNELEKDRPDCVRLEYGDARDHVSDWYDIWLDEFPFGRIDYQGRARVDKKPLKKPTCKRIITDLGRDLVGLIFDDEGISAVGLPKSATPENWKVEEELTLADVMG